MDAHGQIGPNIIGYEDDVHSVARDVAVGLPVFVKLTDRMTQYRLLVVRCDGIAFHIGGGGDANLGTLDVPAAAWLFVSCVEKGAHVFRIGSFLSGDFVAGKLGLAGVVDGGIVAEFLTRLGGVFDQRTLQGVRP